MIAFVSVIGGWATPTEAQATEIYRCEVNGVVTFVDSPRACPSGQAVHQRTVETHAPSPPSQPVEQPDRFGRGGRSEPPERSMRRERLAEPGQWPPARTRQTPPPATAAPAQPSALRSASTTIDEVAAVSKCQKTSGDPTALRACLAAVRRTQVRRIATDRYALLVRAVAEYLVLPADGSTLLAVSKKGRPPGWCETVLQDIVAGRNFDVVDDETVGGPRWMGSLVTDVRQAGPILDDNFRVWQLGNATVPDGYVTLRWRGTELLLLRLSAICGENNGTAWCSPRRYTFISIYDDQSGCSVQSVGRQYWANWQQHLTPIRVRP